MKLDIPLLNQILIKTTGDPCHEYDNQRLLNLPQSYSDPILDLQFPDEDLYIDPKL